jgi:hypothetical protein
MRRRKKKSLIVRSPDPIAKPSVWLAFDLAIAMQRVGEGPRNKTADNAESETRLGPIVIDLKIVLQLFFLPSSRSQTGTNGTAAPSEGSDFSEDHDLPKINHKPFFRRLSFKALRKGKVIKLMVMTQNHIWIR